MEIRNNDESTTNTKTGHNRENLVFYIDVTGGRTRDLGTWRNMKAGKQITQPKRSFF